MNDSGGIFRVNSLGVVYLDLYRSNSLREDMKNFIFCYKSKVNNRCIINRVLELVSIRAIPYS